MTTIDIADRARPPARRQRTAHCPADDWTFEPKYTDGTCPLCGWVPDGWAAARHVPGIWRLAVAALLLSALVCWLTVAVYSRGGA